MEYGLLSNEKHEIRIKTCSEGLFESVDSLRSMKALFLAWPQVWGLYLGWFFLHCVLGGEI